jgi:hypothetical protein
MNAVKIALYFTTSKFAAYLILIIGSVYSFVFKDSSALIATFTAVSGLLIVKTYTTSKTDQENNKNKENI